MAGLDGVEVAAATAGASAALVKDTTTTAFRTDVIAESARQPVLVDFWAPWCGPCKQLTPIIEKVVAEAEGKVKLVKMDIEAHPQIAGQLGIKSIPAVIAFDKGQPIDGFMGALPESQVRTFIERLVGPLDSAIDEALAAAQSALESGDAAAAVDIFGQVLEVEPQNPVALAGCAQALLATGDLENAAETLDSADAAAAKHPSVVAARAALEVAARAGAVGDQSALLGRIAADPNDHGARLDLALALSAAGDRPGAADALLEIIKRDRTWNDDGGRKQLVQFFEAWGPMDPATIAARRKLSAILFS